jgi:hypothetical protein
MLRTWTIMFLWGAASLGCHGHSGTGRLAATKPQPRMRWPHGTPTAPPCSSSTTRPDCIAGTGQVACNPSRWLQQALERLGPTTQVSCKKSEAHWITLAGERSTEKELFGFKGRSSAELFAIPGLRMHAVGLCCPEAPARRCLSVFLDPCGAPVDEVIRRIADLRQRDPGMANHEIGIRVELTQPGPRCQADDPECLPLSFGAPADPDRDRYPISEAKGSCSHDGECTIGGCATGACLSWREATRQWICPATERSVAPPNLPRACGCVARECRWFE